jgi:hypothetical protein
MQTLFLKAALENERFRLWRKAVKDHPRMTPTSADIIEKEIEEKLKIFARDLQLTDPEKHPRQFDFDFLREFPVGRRFKHSKIPR